MPSSLGHLERPHKILYISSQPEERARPAPVTKNTECIVVPNLAVEREISRIIMGRSEVEYLEVFVV